MHWDETDPPPLSASPARHICAADGQLRLRRAEPPDLPFLVDLIGHDDVAAFLAAVSASDPDELRIELGRSREEPAYHGRLIAEVADTTWEKVGSIAYEVVNRRSRIAYVSALAIAPSQTGKGLGAATARLALDYLLDEVGYHRVQCEIYRFNERALAVARRAGFTQEGVRRRAYWRRGAWVDGVLFGAVAEDVARLGDPG